jgi:hypothetical protein
VRLTTAPKRKVLRILPAGRRRMYRHFLAIEGRTDLRAHLDSLVWLDATQALAVGAGRPDVPAASIKGRSPASP